MQLVVLIGGSVRCLYAEAIDLRRLGTLQIERASHVEPTPDGQWVADLSPVGGPKLGPFDNRGQALAAEAVWLEVHWLAPTAA
jgi:hypothetical protein